MTEPNRDERPRIVVAGAGVAALEFLLALGELAPGRAAVEVIAPDVYFTYRPLAVAQTFEVGDAYHIELDRVMSHVAARQVHTQVASVDRLARVAFTATGEAIPYDMLVVATGARGEEALPGALTFHGWRDEQASPRAARRTRRGQRLVGRLRGAPWDQLGAPALRARAAERQPT